MDIFSVLQSNPSVFASRLGAMQWSGMDRQLVASATTRDLLIAQPFFAGADGLTLNTCSLFASGNTGVNTVQFGVYSTAPAEDRDVYPKDLVAESNTVNYAAGVTGVLRSSGWVGGASSILLRNGLYWLAVVVGGAGTRQFYGPTSSDASFWLGFTAADGYPWMGLTTPHVAGNALPASFPAGASLFSTLTTTSRLFVGMT